MKVNDGNYVKENLQLNKTIYRIRPQGESVKLKMSKIFRRKFLSKSLPAVAVLGVDVTSQFD